MYRPEEEKERILHMLQQDSLLDDQPDLLSRTIEFAIEELDEFEQKFHHFLESVAHLNVYQDLIAAPMYKGAIQMIDQAKYLIERNYTQTELDAMQETEFNDIVKIQKRRKDVLRKIAKMYFNR